MITDFVLLRLCARASEDLSAIEVISLLLLLLLLLLRWHVLFRDGASIWCSLNAENT